MEKIYEEKPASQHVLHTEGGSLFKDIRCIYKFKEVIGGGHFGTVRLAYKKNIEPKKLYAIKSISKKNINEKDFDEMIKEVDILSKLDHPNIIKFIETYNDEYYFHIVMEVAKGKDVFDKIIEEGSLTEDTVAHITYKVLSALIYCHSRGICHRDIKPENILFEHETNEGEIKLIDFGLSRKYNEKEKMQTVLGTPYYVAPEVLQGSYDEKCDIWSVGAFMYIMLTGEPPFTGKNSQTIFKNILNTEPCFKDEKFSAFSKDLIDILKKCLCKDSSERPSAEELLKHSWFTAENEKIHTVNDKQLKDCLLKMKEFKFDSSIHKFALKYILNNLLSYEIIKEYTILFESIDKNNKGLLSFNDLKEAYDYIDVKIEEEKLRSIFNIINNDYIDFNDFLMLSLDYMKIIDKNVLYETFCYLDIDKNGYITSDDIEASMLRFGIRPLNKEEVEIFINEQSQGKKGYISFDDFVFIFHTCNVM